ncbi:hypothetical protein GCM10022415_23360 [Knoellia locipacati]|uniref:Glycosyl transferase family 4 n=1 Tax=Knoellia locipacati TaxID=882824 RepID=A0A512T232_9MICO|nr:hypothetical protein [Knoellia locipacati]GEQ14285.1 hypothetical protein KLO01_23320 [Knoellia locipacati]
MSRRPVVAALVAAATAGGLSALRRSLPEGLRAPWDRTNHAGDTVTLLEGPILAVAAAAGAVAGGSPSAPGVVASLGSAAFGALDDLAGDSASKGFKGHLGALARGEVTTGAVKIVGIGATGLVAAALADRRSGRGAALRSGHGSAPGVLATLVGGAAIAGAANLANLFDLRPGRTLKVTAVAGLPALLPPGAAGAATAAAALGAAAGILPDDLAGRSMLGDTGANAAGALVGLAIVERTGLRGRLAVLAVTAGLTVLSEKVSFSKVIEGNDVLRRLDALGRPKR